MDILGSCSSCKQLQFDIRTGVSRYMPHFFLLLLITQCVLPSNVPTPSGTPLVTRFSDTNDGANPYFRYMHMTDSHIFIGAHQYIYRLDLTNITLSKRSPRLLAADDRVQGCINQGLGEASYKCSNHIRAIAFQGNNIYACGTGAFWPTEYYLDLDLDEIQSTTQGGGRLKCPYDPDDSCTSIYIKNGNPDGYEALYSGSTFQTSLTAGIYRPSLGAGTIESLRTEHTDQYFNTPTFVNSFDAGEYVYFFFREIAVEYANCGDAIYSRLGRVCKSDRGGPNLLDRDWTTYLKAKLDCSISGEFPFYFNHLHDVKRIDDTFYGVFTTSKNGFYGSAVCAFGQEQIDAAFSGTFKEQQYTNSLWQPTPEDRIPVERPGNCIDNSKEMSDHSEQFIQAHPLMWEPVEHITKDIGVPMFHQSGVMFTNMAIDIRQNYNIYYLVTDAGQLHKVIQWRAGSEIKSNTVMTWTLFDHDTEVLKLELINSQSSDQDDQLYVLSTEAVLQLSVAQCSEYSTCTQCLHDPHCGWHRWDARCVSRTTSNALQTHDDPRDLDTLQVCNSLCKVSTSTTHHVVRIPGDAVAPLSCRSRCDVDEVTWYHDNVQVPDNSKYTLTSEHGLVIFNVSMADTGEYQCLSHGVELAKHNVQLDTDCGADTECVWKKNFREWCNHFDSYRREYNNWVCLKEQCLNEPDGQCMPQTVQEQCPHSP